MGLELAQAKDKLEEGGGPRERLQCCAPGLLFEPHPLRDVHLSHLSAASSSASSPCLACKQHAYSTTCGTEKNNQGQKGTENTTPCLENLVKQKEQRGQETSTAQFQMQTVTKEMNLLVLVLGAAQAQVPQPHRATGASFKCHPEFASCSTPAHLIWPSAFSAEPGAPTDPHLSHPTTDILLIIQCKSGRKLMCHLLAGRTKHLNVRVC